MTNIVNTLISPNISTDSHYIIEKSFFSCIECNQLTLNLYEPLCCSKFLCIHCKNKLRKESKCPNCKALNPKFKYCSMAKKILLSSIINCPLCDYENECVNLIDHLKQQHTIQIYDKQVLKNNKELFEILLTSYEFEPEKKYYAHNHSVIIKQVSENDKCFLCEKRRPNPINPIDTGSSIQFDENKKAKIEQEKIEIKKDIEEKKEKIDALGKFLVENIIFNCEICDKNFCKSCIESTKIYMKSRLHEHDMKLFFGIKPWTCASIKLENKFSSDSYEDKNNLKEFPRYRCKTCDFNLCEECMFEYVE